MDTNTVKPMKTLKDTEYKSMEVEANDSKHDRFEELDLNETETLLDEVDCPENCLERADHNDQYEPDGLKVELYDQTETETRELEYLSSNQDDEYMGEMIEKKSESLTA